MVMPGGRASVQSGRPPPIQLKPDELIDGAMRSRQKSRIEPPVQGHLTVEPLQ